VIATWLIVSVFALLGTGLVVATVSAHVWQPAVVAALVNAVWLVVLGLVLPGTGLVVLTIAPYVWPAGAARRRSLGRWVAGVAAVVLVFFMCRGALADAAALDLSMVAK
jgi:hypothetical protein